MNSSKLTKKFLATSFAFAIIITTGLNVALADTSINSEDKVTLLEFPVSSQQILETNFYNLSQKNFQAFSKGDSLIVSSSTESNFWVVVRGKGELYNGYFLENRLHLRLVQKFMDFVEPSNADNLILSVLQVGKILYVAAWNGSSSDNSCGGIVINRYSVISNFRIGKAEKIFASTPCLTGPATGAIAAQLASDGKSLFFAAGNQIYAWKNGNFPYEGYSNLAKMSAPPSTNIFGKVIKINLDSKIITQVSKGLRNPNGLFYSKQFLRLMHTDNGPRGGDGLYIDSQGADFGWPRVSLGLPYGPDTGQNFRVNTYADYSPPLFGWTPSISPTQIVQVDKTNIFGKYWSSDLLVGSLKDAAIHRIRISKVNQDLRVLYDERFKLQNARLRAIIQLSGEFGGILVSTDDGQLILLDNPSEDVVAKTPQQP
jgi:glucose/arabinose dehydrogenase